MRELKRTPEKSSVTQAIVTFIFVLSMIDFSMINQEDTILHMYIRNELEG